MRLEKTLWKDWLSHSSLKSDMVYKFTTREIAEKMVNEGSFKIGGLNEYKTIESQSLVDDDEGLNKTFAKGTVHLKDIHANSAFHRVMSFKNSDGSIPPVTFSNLNFGVGFDFPVMCFASSKSETVRQSLCDDINRYDTCVRVSSIRSVGNIICREMNMLAEPGAATLKFISLPVIYREKAREVTKESPANIVSAFEKDPKFSANCEHRLIFAFNQVDPACQLIHQETPNSEEKTNSIIGAIPELKQYFSIID